MAGCEIHTVFTGLSGNHIKGFNSHGIVAVKNKEVCQRDLDRVIDAAKAVAIPTDREVLQILPQDYIIDDQDGIKEPLGMSGVRLEARVHIVTSAVTSAQNIVKCCNRAGLNIGDIVLMPLAAAEAVLSARRARVGRSIGGYRQRHDGYRGFSRWHGKTQRGAERRRQSSYERYRRGPADPYR